MVRHVGTWDRRSDYARIVGLVEGDNMLWKAEKGLENKIETRSGVQVPRAFKDHVKVLGVEDEIGFERSKANTDWYRETESLPAFPVLSKDRLGLFLPSSREEPRWVDEELLTLS